MRTVFPLIFISAFFLFACTGNDPNLVTITGEIANPIGESVAFTNSDTSFTTTSDEDGTFSIEFVLDSSAYFNFEHGVEVTAMYIKPGDNIHLTIDTEQFDETITYEGSPASTYLARSYLMEENTKFFGAEYYLGSQEAYEAFLDDFKASLINELEKLSDTAFIRKERENTGETTDYYLGRYTRFREYYSKYGKDVLKYMMEKNELRDKFNFYEAVETLNSADFNSLLDEYTNTMASLLGEVEDEEYAAKEKIALVTTTDLWKERKVYYDKMPKAGEPAVDFTYPDMEGNEVSLSSLQESLVYVDVWATWCGPCLGEIPSLKELEEHYHGKNITFLSVSVDTDKEAWMKMVEEDELGGIQLWADGWSQITKDYAIFGIPRFMLISKEGNIISSDAPRPSSPDIRQLLDENL